MMQATRGQVLMSGLLSAAVGAVLPRSEPARPASTSRPNRVQAVMVRAPDDTMMTVLTDHAAIDKVVANPALFSNVGSLAAFIVANDLPAVRHKPTLTLLYFLREETDVVYIEAAGLFGLELGASAVSEMSADGRTDYLGELAAPSYQTMIGWRGNPAGDIEFTQRVLCHPGGRYLLPSDVAPESTTSVDLIILTGQYSLEIPQA